MALVKYIGTPIEDLNKLGESGPGRRSRVAHIAKKQLCRWFPQYHPRSVHITEDNRAWGE
jgi:hypothetical protein